MVSGPSSTSLKSIVTPLPNNPRLNRVDFGYATRIRNENESNIFSEDGS
jgi:hypothetical protein